MTSSLESLGFAGPEFGWALGSYQAMRWDGSAWTEAQNAPFNISAVQFLSPDLGWAVGYMGSIYQWDGESWTEEPSPTHNGLYALAVNGPEDAWAVGQFGVILHLTNEKLPSGRVGLPAATPTVPPTLAPTLTLVPTASPTASLPAPTDTVVAPTQPVQTPSEPSPTGGSPCSTALLVVAGIAALGLRRARKTSPPGLPGG